MRTCTCTLNGSPSPVTVSTAVTDTAALTVIHQPEHAAYSPDCSKRSTCTRNPHPKKITSREARS